DNFLTLITPVLITQLPSSARGCRRERDSHNAGRCGGLVRNSTPGRAAGRGPGQTKDSIRQAKGRNPAGRERDVQRTLQAAAQARASLPQGTVTNPSSGEPDMNDLLFIGTVIAFFVIGGLYVRFCEKL
ncbi:MAG: hypothetical protein WCS99_11950, partial [Limisphaerales bacterium]